MKIIFTVTNDLSYDQRMHRICTTLALNGYEVVLVGRKLPASLPLPDRPFGQKRLACLFRKGPLFYAEYNLRLFFYLLFCPARLFCAIDLDTILPCYLASRLRKKARVYDAHELFTEMKEIATRPSVLRAWMWIERFAVPKFRNGYTVNQSIAQELQRRYGVNYAVIRNLPVKREVAAAPARPDLVIYQGAVNEGRSFETLIPAMRQVKGRLLICGEGNFMEQTRQLVADNGVQDKVELRGYVPPGELATLTPTTRVAVMLFEATGMNQYHSLSNRFFDYIMAGVPQVCVNYPEYKAINDQYDIALMIDDTRPDTIAAAINRLLQDEALYQHLRQSCLRAREVLNWSNEEKKLLDFYHTFGAGTLPAPAAEND